MSDDQNSESSDIEPRPSSPDGAEGGELETTATAASVVPFEDLAAPEPLPASPPESARWLAFAGILIGGLLGGLIGYGVADLLSESFTWSAFGGLIGGLGGAIGVGIVSALTLRAMNEWREVNHPEAEQ